MKAGINYVMIKVNRTREELISGIYKNRDNTLFISDATLNKPNQSGAHKCQTGIVKSVGVLYKDKMKWETTNELQEGDLAVYYFNDDAWNKSRYWIDGEDVYFFIRYENIYFVIREEKIIPVNGYVLVEPIDTPTNFLTEHIKEKSKTYGIVKHIGTPLINTKITGKQEVEFDDEVPRMNGSQFTGYGLKENDFVFFPSWCAKPIMYDTQNFVGELYAMHRFGMWCVIEDKSKVTLKENAKQVKHQDMEMSGEEIEQAQREWARVQSEGRDKPKTLYY